MHQFSEKQRFDKQRFDNAQEAVGAAAAPSDTFSSGKGGGAAEGTAGQNARRGPSQHLALRRLLNQCYVLSSTADEVLERRVTDPDTGGIAS
jgi:hypothetical protein